MIQFFGLFLLLTPCVVTDVCKKRLPVLYMLIFAATSVLLNLAFGKVSVTDMALGAILGTVFLGIAKATKGAIGMGDGILIGAMGTWVGIFSVSAMTLFGFLLAAVFGFFYIKVTKKSVKSTLPFAPFMAVSALITSGVTWIGGNSVW